MGTARTVDTVEDIASSTKLDDILRNGAKEHIFQGELRSKGNIGGGHVEKTLIDEIQVMQRIPEPPIDGQPYSVILKNMESGMEVPKNMFPQDWSMEQVERAIGEAYINRSYTGKGNIWEAEIEGIKIHMYLNGAEEIISAFPIV